MKCKYGCNAPLEIVNFDDIELTAIIRCSSCLTPCGKLAEKKNCPCCGYPKCGHDHIDSLNIRQ
jgi:hypothetical protein